VDVDLQLGIARQRKQQILHTHVVHDDAVGFRSWRWFGLRQHRRDLDRRGDHAFRTRRISADVRSGRPDWRRGATRERNRE